MAVPASARFRVNGAITTRCWRSSAPTFVEVKSLVDCELLIAYDFCVCWYVKDVVLPLAGELYGRTWLVYKPPDRGRGRTSAHHN